MEKVVEPKYYHRPVTLQDVSTTLPLRDCVITFSGYSHHERQYLENLGTFLGAK